MRIVYLSTDPGIAYGGTKGASVHLGELVAALARQGVDVLLLVASIAADASPPSGVQLEQLPRTGKHVPADERLASEPTRVAFVAERAHAFGADALYERLALHSAAGVDAARIVGVPHLVELNAPLLEEAATYRRLEQPCIADALERRTLCEASVVLPVSRPLAQYASSRGARRVEVSPNAVAWERYAALPARAPDPPVVVVFAGTLRRWHGAEVIADAWDMLGGDAPPLRVVGDGPCAPELQAVGAEMLGAMAPGQVPAQLASAHIGLAPYTRTGPRYFSPLKLFEYLAAGLAVVAGDLPGVVDVTADDHRVVIPAGDAGRLADAVAGLVGDPAQRAALGRAGRAHVARRHTWAHRAARVTALVREIRAV